MELKDWIRKDMSRFVRRHEPKTRVSVPIRHEQATLVSTRDYETQIRLALKHDRFNHACQLFNELKKAFLSLPINHQEERRQYYRLLQMAYKEIYEYVADKHKTSRILEEMQGSDNVFGTTKSGVRSAAPRASIEESMHKQEAAPPQPALAQASASQVASEVQEPAMPEDAVVEPKAQIDTPVVEEEVVAEPEERAVAEPALPEETDAPQMPAVADDDELRAAQEELDRWKNAYFANEVHIIRKNPQPEEEPAPPQAVADTQDAEAFSSLYVRGVQALSAGDYEQAAQLFMRRVQQNPNDRAARIRLNECLEVLHGSTT